MLVVRLMQPPVKPKFADSESWQKADMLMQPALIRTIDNIRKRLESETTWQGEYREFPIWPEGVTEETQAKLALLQQELKTATPEQVDAIEDALAQIPRSMPGYELVLTHPQQVDAPVVVNLWELCYRVCFLNPDAVIAGTEVVQVDEGLIEADTQEVDWPQIDKKSHAIVDAIFAELTK
jgi:hypothetical protein